MLKNPAILRPNMRGVIARLQTLLWVYLLICSFVNYRFYTALEKKAKDLQVQAGLKHNLTVKLDEASIIRFCSTKSDSIDELSMIVSDINQEIE